MGREEERCAVYAEILEVLLHRSGQIHTVSLDVLNEQYFLVKSDEFVEECVRDLDAGDFPVSYSERTAVVELTDTTEAEEKIAAIRSDLYDLDL